jgi:pimeloyl-ACP methyl ester carboxylesterase
LTLVALTLVFVFFVAPYWLADAITTFGTRPMDLELTSSPADFEIEFEDVAFSSTDGVPLKGWYLGGGDRGASIVCSHGLFRSRREVLDRAVLLRKAGFNVLLADFRRHGKSGGDRVTLGFKERLDVEGAIRFLQDRNPHDRILLFGVSMGAAASLLAAAESPEVRLVIADSSFLSFEHTVTHHLKLFFGLPRFPLADELIFFIERRAGFQKENFDLEKAVAEIGDRPILFIAGGEDERTPIELQLRRAL